MGKILINLLLIFIVLPAYSKEINLKTEGDKSPIVNSSGGDVNINYDNKDQIDYYEFKLFFWSTL